MGGMRLGGTNPYTNSFGGNGLGIQKESSVWVGSPKSEMRRSIYITCLFLDYMVVILPNDMAPL